MKMPEYRHLLSVAIRRESENLAYGPMHSNEGAHRDAWQASLGLSESDDPNAIITDYLIQQDLTEAGMDDCKHVLVAHLAKEDGRLHDAARENLTAAIAGNAEGMYNYGIALLNGRGVRKNIQEAAAWLEKAAAMPESPVTFKNTGIAEALNALGNFYNDGVYYRQDKIRAREYWERAAERGGHSGCNNLGICFMDGTHGVSMDLARARDLFRQSAESLNNEAMSNLALLHASLFDFETAARWADAAFSFGFVPAAEKADEYRKLDKTWKQLPAEVADQYAKLNTMSEKIENPTHTRTNKTPSVEELRAIDTPYCKRLLSARETMIEAMSVGVADLDKAIEVIRIAAHANRIEDSTIVFAVEEARTVYVLANLLLEARVQLTPDLALCLCGTDSTSFVPFWQSMQLKFPNDLTITRRAACAFMFSGYAGADDELGVRLFGKALSLLPRPDDDSDPTTMGLLYEAGVANFLTDNCLLAQEFLTHFLKHAEADGHRKASEAHFMLGLMLLGQNESAFKPGKKRASRLKSLEAKARKHLHEGIALEDCLPAFLQENHESAQRKSLERILGMMSMVTHSATKVSTDAYHCAAKRGGELLHGPRRHPKLCSDTSPLCTTLRKSVAKIAKMTASGHTRNPVSLTPSKSSTGGISTRSALPATIDELFSGLKDHVYVGRSLQCLVVSTPTFTGTSFHMVVEDSQREPTRLAVYNSPPSLLEKLVPGRALKLLNPYVRIAGDRSIMLRVDNPNGTIQLGETFAICWVCSVEEQSDQQLKSCAKCHKALYCSKKCQKQDWTVDGHRYICVTLRAQSHKTKSGTP